MPHTAYLNGIITSPDLRCGMCQQFLSLVKSTSQSIGTGIHPEISLSEMPCGESAGAASGSINKYNFNFIKYNNII